MPLPDVRLRVSSSELAPLAEILKEIGYDESNLSGLLGLWDLSLMDAMAMPNYIWRCQMAQTSLSDLALLFLLGEGVSNDRIGKLLGPALLSSLTTCGVLFRNSDTVFCQLALFPCLGMYVFTDFWVTETGQELGHVYELGTDSFLLARLTPRRGDERALDLCTGSGIHAILSAAQCMASEALDINPRALDYTALNSAVNSVKVDTYESDLYTAVSGRRYDLITANPPFVPSPDRKVRVHRSAGESGEEVPERLVAGLPTHLANDGLFSMILEFPVLEGEKYLQRLERWLGEKKGWGIAVLSFGEISVSNYIRSHMGTSLDYSTKFRSYLESYERQGILSMDFANIFIRKEKSDRPNWKVYRRVKWPNFGLSLHIADWLRDLSIYQSLDWEPDPDWAPKTSRYYRMLWRNSDHSQGFLEPSTENWLAEGKLTSDQAELMSRISGDKRVSELKTQWQKDGLDAKSFHEALRELGLRSALV
jgi:methylase of polypeptide subunit release factors